MFFVVHIPTSFWVDGALPSTAHKCLQLTCISCAACVVASVSAILYYFLNHLILLGTTLHVSCKDTGDGLCCVFGSAVSVQSRVLNSLHNSHDMHNLCIPKWNWRGAFSACICLSTAPNKEKWIEEQRKNDVQSRDGA